MTQHKVQYIPINTPLEYPVKDETMCNILFKNVYKIIKALSEELHVILVTCLFMNIHIDDSIYLSYILYDAWWIKQFQ